MEGAISSPAAPLLSALEALYGDCEVGAVPALSGAYDLEVVWDDQLHGHRDIYVEAGDHEHLIHIRGAAFDELMSGNPHAVISAEQGYSRLES